MAAACCTMPTHGTPGLVFTIGCASAVALSASEGEHNATVATMLTVNRFDLLRMFSPKSVFDAGVKVEGKSHLCNFHVRQIRRLPIRYEGELTL